MWAPVITILLMCSHCLVKSLDSNVIRSSKEILDSSQQQVRSRSGTVDRGVHGSGNARRRGADVSSNSNNRTMPCSTPDCHVPLRDRCSNRAQRRGSATTTQDRQTDRHTDRYRERQRDGEKPTSPSAEGNRTKASEMSSCVRSRDCEVGLCCVRYLKGKRCQRIPVEGEACLVKGRAKLQRNLGRCDCAPGLSCHPSRRVEATKATNQGVCQARKRHGQRKTRHSGEKRRTAERSC